MASVLCKIYCAKCGKLLGQRTLQYAHTEPTTVRRSSTSTGSSVLRKESVVPVTVSNPHGTSEGSAFVYGVRRFKGLLGLLLRKR